RLPLRHPRARPFPYTTLFRSEGLQPRHGRAVRLVPEGRPERLEVAPEDVRPAEPVVVEEGGVHRRGAAVDDELGATVRHARERQDRKSTRLNSSHEWISYAVF